MKQCAFPYAIHFVIVTQLIVKHFPKKINSQNKKKFIDRIGYRIPTNIAETIGKQIRNINNGATKVDSSGNTISQTNQPKFNKKSKKPRPIQRSLTPHFDCCPETYHNATNKNKWRPIQCFVSLTDNLLPNTGGFEAVPGFHREFRTWVENNRMFRPLSDPSEVQVHPQPCIGEYTHLSPAHDRELLKRVQHIPVMAGSVVFWDNRIPHGNSYRNDPTPNNCNNGNSSQHVQSDLGILGAGARAVVYCSFLPDVEINRNFLKKQLRDWKDGRDPKVGDRWIKQEENESVNNQSGESAECGASENGGDATKHLTELGKKLIGIVDW